MKTLFEWRTPSASLQATTDKKTHLPLTNRPAETLLPRSDKPRYFYRTRPSAAAVPPTKPGSAPGTESAWCDVPPTLPPSSVNTPFMPLTEHHPTTPGHVGSRRGHADVDNSDIASPPIPKRLHLPGHHQQADLEFCERRTDAMPDYELDWPSFPTQSTSRVPAPPCAPKSLLQPDRPVIVRVGPPELRIFRSKLPSHLMGYLNPILQISEAYAATLPHGWQTQLYSLTKQDIPLQRIPQGPSLSMLITRYMVGLTRDLFGTNGEQMSRFPCKVSMDTNQPHVLKYNRDSRGVQLHHDRCDVTCNLVLNESHEYIGGGTHFPAARAIVRLEKGEFLLHPGSLVHGGSPIKGGHRYLLVYFFDLDDNNSVDSCHDQRQHVKRRNGEHSKSEGNVRAKLTVPLPPAAIHARMAALP